MIETIELIICLSILLVVISFPLYVYYSWKKNDRILKEKAERINLCDLYKCEFIPTDPFKEPIVDYVRIKEIRYVRNNEPWVSYYYIKPPIDAVKTKKLKYFLEDYTLVKTTEDWE